MKREREINLGSNDSYAYVQRNAQGNGMNDMMQT
jgi:hypothetical protein